MKGILNQKQGFFKKKILGNKFKQRIVLKKCVILKIHIQ